MDIELKQALEAMEKRILERIHDTEARLLEKAPEKSGVVRGLAPRTRALIFWVTILIGALAMWQFVKTANSGQKVQEIRVVPETSPKSAP